MQLKVDKVSENADGTVTVNFEIDDDYEQFIKQVLGVEELTDEMVQNFINNEVQKMLDDKARQMELKNVSEG